MKLLVQLYILSYRQGIPYGTVKGKYKGMTIRFNNNYKELKLVQSNKIGQPTLLSSILMTARGKGTNSRWNSSNTCTNNNVIEKKDGKRKTWSTAIYVDDVEDTA